MENSIETEIENEVENDVTTSDVIRNMVDTILAGNASDAKDTFNSLMNFKVADALDNRKIELSQTLYAREE